MAIIYNGTNIPTTSHIYYNGTDLDKVIYNGVVVWKKNKYVIKAGVVQDSSMIISGKWTGSWSHGYNKNEPWETVANEAAMGDIKCYGKQINGVYHQAKPDGGTTDCSFWNIGLGVIQFSDAVAGKKVRLRVVANYASRYFGCTECSVKNGSTLVKNAYYQNKGSDLNKISWEETFTMDPNGTLTFYVRFTDSNASWGPSIRFGIYDLELVD